jgi:predicted nucleic acid-binding protein
MNAVFLDHLSFAVMRRLGIAEAFTNDKSCGAKRR